MPLFGSCSAFDADVEKATDEKNTSEDWGLILDICEKVGRQPDGPHDCLKSIVKRLHHRVPLVAMQALTRELYRRGHIIKWMVCQHIGDPFTLHHIHQALHRKLLDACIKNCGHAFHLEVCSREFMSECGTFINQKAHPKVVRKFRYFVKKWSEMPEFKKDPALNLMQVLYEGLKREGADFTDPDASPSKTTSSAQAAKEDEDMAKAIALSLAKAKVGSAYPTSWSPSYSAASDSCMLMKPEADKHVHFDHRTVFSTSKVLYSVRALYDFEAAEDNELTFYAGDLISVTDDSDTNWWKGFNQRGDGLFPSNFVTADLSVEPERSEREKELSTVTADIQSSAGAKPNKIEIDESKIDEALRLIQNAHPTGESQPDTSDTIRLEEHCMAMGPLIDAELEKVDRDCSILVELNQRVMAALQMYHALMKENPVYSAQPPTMPPFIPPGSPYPAAVGVGPTQQQTLYSGQQPFMGAPGPGVVGTPAMTPASQTPASQTPVSQTPASQTPVSQTPASQTPASQTPASQTPASQTPASQTPASQTPASQTPAMTPASQTPPSQTPASQTPAMTPASQTPASQTPASWTPASQTPAMTPASQTPASQTPASWTPASQTPSVTSDPAPSQNVSSLPLNIPPASDSEPNTPLVPTTVATAYATAASTSDTNTNTSNRFD